MRWQKRARNVVLAIVSVAAIMPVGLARPATHAAASISVVMITSESGLGDKSFNDQMVKGFYRAKSDLGVNFNVIQPHSIAEFQPAIERAAAAGTYKIIIGSSFDMIAAMQAVAKQYPKQAFGLVDVGANPLGPNIVSTVTADWEGSALVGAIAARVTKTGTIGFVGGKDIAIIHRFWIGYYFGAKLSNPKVNVLQSFTGSFTDPAGGTEYANALYDKGSDINFGVAGLTTVGVLAAAKSHNKLAIGVDSDENCLDKGHVLTSMVKRVDNEAYALIKATVKGQNLGGKILTFGPAEGGVIAAMDSCNKGLIPAAVLTYAKQFSAQLLSGKIVVPNYFDLKKGQKMMGTPAIPVPSQT